MKLFSYVVARDYGFAPNPFYGYCTLATCKPRIRALAEKGDWVIGTGAKTKYNLSGKLIFAMQVEETMNFDDYWKDQRFFSKRPILNGSLKQIYGDNIYHSNRGNWIQTDSHHSHNKGRQNRKNINHDTSVNRVLVSKKFVYFGENAISIPKSFRQSKASKKDICCPGQGHRIFPAEAAQSFQKWLEKKEQWGVEGAPLEFRKHLHNLAG